MRDGATQLVHLTHIDVERPRGTKEENDELETSVRQHGVLQPVLLRRREDGRFALLAGRRRTAAARAAGLESIEAVVRDVTDEEAEVIELTENLQRSDLSPMTEAVGYQRLVQGHSLSIDQVATRVGRPRSTVRARLLLLRLPTHVKVALAEDRVTMAVAHLVARIDNDALRERAAAQLVPKKKGAPAASIETARSWAMQNAYLSLKSAPFSTTLVDLVPSTPACGSCPKRTGNERVLFADVADDQTCTDPACFRAKVAAHTESVAASHAKHGGEVLDEKASAALFYSQDHVSLRSSDYRQVDERDYGVDPKNRTYGELAKKAQVLPVMARHPMAGPVMLLRRKDIPAILKAAGVKRERGASSDTQQASMKKARDRSALMARVSDRVIEETITRLAGKPHAWSILVDAMADASWHDVIARVAKRRAFDKGKRRAEDVVREAAKSMDTANRERLVLELALTRFAWSSYGGFGKVLLRAAKSVGVNVAAVERSEAKAVAVEKKRGGKARAAKAVALLLAVALSSLATGCDRGASLDVSGMQRVIDESRCEQICVDRHVDVEPAVLDRCDRIIPCRERRRNADGR